MDRYFGLFGVAAILALAFLLSNNRKAINYRPVLVGLLIQLCLAVFILKVPFGQKLFQHVGDFVTKFLNFSDEGARFVFGLLVDKSKLSEIFGPNNSFIFYFNIIPTIIFVSALVSVAYHIGLMQLIVSFLAKIVYKLMKVSGSEALSNVASTFVGQVEAQIMIKPYLSGMTRSELLASMTGSMACIAGGIMAVYMKMGVPASYLIAASIMAAPGALVISKIVFPETEKSETGGAVKLEIKKTHANLMDAIMHGAGDGMRVGINVVAMLIAVIAIIALIDAGLGKGGRFLCNHTSIAHSILGLDLTQLSLKNIFGAVFAPMAYLMGIPWNEAHVAGNMMGTKMAINEFVAYNELTPMIRNHMLSAKTITILSFALCGFANFSSIAIQVGGIGELAPERKTDLAKLGMKAMICGTMASYLSATIAGMLI
ncbi:MAG: NupC/NupG family nucleoside CNT transporter [Bacteroidia bacterium]